LNNTLDSLHAPACFKEENVYYIYNAVLQIFVPTGENVSVISCKIYKQFLYSTFQKVIQEENLDEDEQLARALALSLEPLTSRPKSSSIRVEDRLQQTAKRGRSDKICKANAL